MHHKLISAIPLILATVAAASVIPVRRTEDNSYGSNVARGGATSNDCLVGVLKDGICIPYDERDDTDSSGSTDTQGNDDCFGLLENGICIALDGRDNTDSASTDTQGNNADETANGCTLNIFGRCILDKRQDSSTDTNSGDNDPSDTNSGNGNTNTQDNDEKQPDLKNDCTIKVFGVCVNLSKRGGLKAGNAEVVNPGVGFKIELHL